MDALLESLTKSLTEQGWKVEMQENTQIPTEIAQRYDSLPTDYIYFLRNMKACVNSAETVWMLCPDDFAPQGEDGFAWNEFEKMSLDAAEGDNIWTAEIKSFWNEHLPICLSLKDGYSYYALCLKDGTIVTGEEPEFEETTEVAPSFRDFLQMLCNGKHTKTNEFFKDTQLHEMNGGATEDGMDRANQAKTPLQGAF